MDSDRDRVPGHVRAVLACGRHPVGAVGAVLQLRQRRLPRQQLVLAVAVGASGAGCC